MARSLTFLVRSSIGPGEITSPWVALNAGENMVAMLLNAVLAQWQSATNMLISFELRASSDGGLSVAWKAAFTAEGGIIPPDPEDGVVRFPGIEVGLPVNTTHVQCSITLNRTFSVGINGDLKTRAVIAGR